MKNSIRYIVFIFYVEYQISIEKYVNLQYITQRKTHFLRLLYSSPNEVCSYFEDNLCV